MPNSARYNKENGAFNNNEFNNDEDDPVLKK